VTSNKTLGYSLVDMLDEVKKTPIHLPRFEDLAGHHVAVFRTKGGSGERHALKLEKDQWEARGRKVLIVKLYSDSINENKKYWRDYGAEISLEDVSTMKLSSQIIVNWLDVNELSILLSNVSRCQTTCIFTTGTGSGGGLVRKIKAIQQICEKIVLSINLSDFSGLERANRIHEVSNENDCIWRDKIHYVFWNTNNSMRTNVPISGVLCSKILK
jgi:hypothetical protein